MWSECVGSSWMMKALPPLTGPSRSPDLNPVMHLRDVMYRSADAAKYGHRLSWSSVMPWSRCGRRPPAESSGGSPDGVGVRTGSLLSHITSCFMSSYAGGLNFLLRPSEWFWMQLSVRLMVLVSVDRRISKDFNLESFVHQDLMWV